MRLAVLIAPLLVAGCASMIPDPPATTPGKTISCSSLVNYPLLTEQTLAAELATDPPETQIFIEDYIKLRQACKTKE